MIRASLGTVAHVNAILEFICFSWRLQLVCAAVLLSLLPPGSHVSAPNSLVRVQLCILSCT